MKVYQPRQYLAAAEWIESKAEKAKAKGTPQQLQIGRALADIGGMLRQAVKDVVKPDLFGAEVVEAKGQIDAVVELWNRMALAPVPKVQRVMAGLRKKIAARMKTFPAVETFNLVFRYVNQSAWHRGEDPKSNGWVVTLTWVVANDERFQRLVEKAVASRPERHVPAGCRHRPPCTDPVACTSRLLKEN